MKELVALTMLVSLVVIPIAGGIFAGRASWRGRLSPEITAILVGSGIFVTLGNAIHDIGLAALWLLGEH